MGSIRLLNLFKYYIGREQGLSILSALFISNWSWELLSFNIYLLSLVWAASFLLFLVFTKKTSKFFYIYLLVMIPILIIQWRTTNNADLNFMNATEKYIFTYRKSEFPVFTINVLGKTKILNLALYIADERAAMLNKFEQNLLRNIDLNLYFFGNHPRERVGVREFEKYSFLFLPFFLVGLYRLVVTKSWELALSFGIPLIWLSFVGQDNSMGPFSLFPFFTAIISVGIFSITNKVIDLFKERRVVLR